MANSKEEKQALAVAADDTPKSATDQTFADYQEALTKTDMPDADTRASTTSSDYNSKRLARWKKKCMLQRQEKTFKVYQSLNETIGIFAQKDAGEIRKKIDQNIDANSKKVGAKLAETTKAIKDARTKLEALKKKGEELDTAANSHAMSADLAAIIKIIGKKEDALKLFSDLKDFGAKAYERGDDTAEVAIRTAGIHASANIESLKPMGVDIEKATTELQADLVKNIKDASAVAAATREGYQTIMQQLVSAKYAWYEAKLSFFGIYDTSEKVKNPDCDFNQNIAKDLDNLQKALEDNFKKASTTAKQQ